MSATGQFLIYCIEMYRREKCLTGRQTYDLFVQTGADGFDGNGDGAGDHHQQNHINQIHIPIQRMRQNGVEGTPVRKPCHFVRIGQDLQDLILCHL